MTASTRITTGTVHQLVPFARNLDIRFSALEPDHVVALLRNARTTAPSAASTAARSWRWPTSPPP
ncbi:hypothetical protein ABZ599_39790 [Streptomyces misionensis]|uniref:hypothetical protein n=1 Tax=Streptomyces misionensis TaxID=67331 RepID=UPI0033C9EDDC